MEILCAIGFLLLTLISSLLEEQFEVQSTLQDLISLLVLSTVDEQKGEEEDPTLQNSAHNFPIDSSGELDYIHTEEILDLQYNDDQTEDIIPEVKIEEPEEQPVYATRS